jgi:putative transposase
MEQKSTQGEARSSCTWEGLEGFVRDHVQRFIQGLWEEEVTAVLERPKSARRRGAEGPSGYRNGYGKPRRVSLTSGTIPVRRPRVRGLEEQCESRVLPLFKRRTQEVGELLPDLYRHGLALGDLE